MMRIAMTPRRSMVEMDTRSKVWIMIDGQYSLGAGIGRQLREEVTRGVSGSAPLVALIRREIRSKSEDQDETSS